MNKIQQTVVYIVMITLIGMVGNQAIPELQASHAPTYVQSQAVSAKRISGIKPVALKDLSGICKAKDVEGSIMLTKDSASIIRGIITLKARPNTNCILKGYPSITMNDKNGALATMQQFSSTTKTVTLTANKTSRSYIAWNNWCGRNPTSTLIVGINLPGDNGYLLIPALDENGKITSVVPDCTSNQRPSTVVTGPFI